MELGGMEEKKLAYLTEKIVELGQLVDTNEDGAVAKLVWRKPGKLSARALEAMSEAVMELAWFRHSRSRNYIVPGK